MLLSTIFGKLEGTTINSLFGRITLKVGNGMDLNTSSLNKRFTLSANTNVIMHVKKLTDEELNIHFQ